MRDCQIFSVASGIIVVASLSPLLRSIFIAISASPPSHDVIVDTSIVKFTGMNNRQFTNENCFNQDSPDSSASAFPSNSSVPPAALDPNTVTGYAAQRSIFPPGYIFPPAPFYYGHYGQAYQQLIPSTNQHQFFTEINQHVAHQSNLALGLTLQPSELRAVSPFHHTTLAFNTFGQDAVPFTTPLQEPYPFINQAHNTRLNQNAFPSPESCPQQPLQQTAMHLNNSMFLPSIRQCISFTPVNDRTGDSNDDQIYHEFVAGMQDQLQSTLIEQHKPSSSGNSLQSHPGLVESQTCKMVQTPGVYQVEVPCPVSDPDISSPGSPGSLQLFEVNFNLSNVHQICKVVFYLENSLQGPYRNLTARVSTNLNMNDIQRRENELQNNSQIEHSTNNQNTDEAVTLDSNIFTSDNTHQLATPSIENDVNSSRSSCQQPLPNESSEEKSIPDA